MSTAIDTIERQFLADCRLPLGERRHCVEVVLVRRFQVGSVGQGVQGLQ